MTINRPLADEIFNEVKPIPSFKQWLSQNPEGTYGEFLQEINEIGEVTA